MIKRIQLDDNEVLMHDFSVVVVRFIPETSLRHRGFGLSVLST